MKSILSIVAVCAAMTLVGCSSTKTVSPGAVGEKNSCCSGKSTADCCKSKSDTSMGAVGEKSGCCADKAKAGTSMGAVGDKASCTKTCPMTGKTETVSPGAVGETKAGCCSGAKTSCTGTKTNG